MKIYPLFNQGELYGAVQHGEHRFYAIEDDDEKHLTSTAIFMHTWLLEDGHWVLRSAISYDHQSPKE